MKLKKWGSLLTAISMVASMAAYVPATVSADEIAHSHYSATVIADAATTAVTKTTTLFSGVFSQAPTVAYEITQIGVYANEEATQPSSSTYELKISPKTAGTVYTIPDNMIYHLAYSLIGNTATDAAKFNTVNLAAANISAITIDGAAQISEEAFVLPTNDVNSTTENLVPVTATLAANASGKIVIDCQATYYDGDKSTATTIAYKDIAFDYTLGNISTNISGITTGYAVIDHTMIANTTNKNHACLYGDKVDTAPEAHGFTEEKGATVANGKHICKCGKSSEDYKYDKTDANYDQGDGIVGGSNQGTGYSYDVHTWDTTKHECTECGADMFFNHKESTTKIDAKTHKVECTTCKKQLATAEAHKFATPVMGAGTTTDCTVCHATHTETATATDHVYEYSWIVNEEGTAKFTNVGTSKGYVCACGDIKDHTTHDPVKANGIHLCGCGYEEKHAATDYTQRYNAKGELYAVASGVTGIICADCGAINPAHATATTAADKHQTGQVTINGDDVTSDATFYNTTEHKHFCFCGEEVTPSASATLADKHYSVIDEANKKHVCDFCKLDLSADTTIGHNHEYVYVVYHTLDTDGTTQIPGNKYDSTLLSEMALPTATEDAFVCACGDIKEHTHAYTYGVDGEHYCACGKKEATTTHKYVTVDASGNPVSGTTSGTTYQQCSICKDIKGHTHTFGEDCECTHDLCDVTNHAYYVNGTKHICSKCGIVGSNEDSSIHTFVVDTENHKHVCACGTETDAHEYVNHECKCGATTHVKSLGTKEVNGKNVHYCTAKVEDDVTACTYVYTAEENYGHVYDPATDVCTFTGDTCNEVNPSHKHVVTVTNPTLASDTCRCGEAIDHAWGLATTAFDKNHQCVNIKHDVTVNSGTVTIKEASNGRCQKTAAHTFTTTDASGNKVTLDFCECGAMNPTVLVKAGVLKATKDAAGTITYAAGVDFTELTSTVKTSYLVELTKLYNEALSYDITNTVNTTATYEDIAVATDKNSQADALEAVEEFKTLYADKANNQAASSAIIDYVVEKDEDGVETTDHSKFGYAVYSDGSTNYDSKVYDKVGETVTIQVKPNPGYKFAGWYSTETPSATDTPLSTSAAYEVPIKDGHTTYYAKFTKNSTKTIQLGKNIKYFSSVTAPIGTYDAQGTLTPALNWSTGTDNFAEVISFLANEEVYITEGPKPAGEDITGIKDKFGNLVSYNVYVDPTTGKVSEPTKTNVANAYKFVVAYDNSFTLETYATTISQGSYIQFKVGGRIVSARKLPTTDVTSIQPVDPEMLGYEFKGWTFDTTTTPVVIEKLKTVSKNVGILVPYFEKIDDLTVTVKNGTIDSDSVKETYTYGDQILVTAELKNAAGKYFSGWYDENGNLISQKRTDWINITKSMVLTAKYDRTEELVLEAGVDLVANRTSTALSLTATRYLTDDMNLVEVGTLYTTKDVSESDLTIENETIGRKSRSAADCSGKNGDYVVTLTISSASQSSTIAARSYFIYEDANGDNHTVYSNAVFAEPVQ